MNRFRRFDHKLSQRLMVPAHSRRWQWARLLAHLGDGQNVFLGLSLIYGLAWLTANADLLWADFAIAIVVVIAVSVVTLIKFTFQRERPQPPGEFVAFKYDSYSFPSGHSGRMAALATGLLFFYPFFGLIVSLITLGIAVCRVAVGVHYVSDIVAGLIVGTTVASVGLILLHYCF
ncbi:MAG TPA: phosphatase PAP2 family protein [Anaerolineae bacterium]|nr:phosphatase PAP2 family protein [Anaerolineae bacterium]HMR66783.1 phosphatase PAP2 family protein [Anaerolineae bacterium]